MVSMVRDLERGLVAAGVPPEQASAIVDGLELRLAELSTKDDVQSLRDDGQALRNDAQSHRNDTQSLQHDVQSLQHDVQSLQHDVQSLRSDVESLRSVVESIQEDLQKIRAEMAQLRGDLRREMDIRIGALELAMSARFEKVEQAINDGLAAQRDSLAAQKDSIDHLDKTFWRVALLMSGMTGGLLAALIYFIVTVA